MSKRDFNSDKWKEYYSAQGKFGIRNPLLKRSLQLVNNRPTKSVAIDLGCGRGDDTLYLLKAGYRVLAYDSQPIALKYLKINVPKKFHGNLTTRTVEFEKLRLRDLQSCLILNASKSLFFCNPSAFDRVWRFIDKSITAGGVFCGHFLGPRDDWAKRRGITALNKTELNDLFKNFTLLYVNEEEDDSGTLTGKSKHWHIFSVIARKN